MILGARALAEFGDDPNRYANGKSRKNYAGTAEPPATPHNRALRALANRLVGILHGCLRHRALYDEHIAWAHRTRVAT